MVAWNQIHSIFDVCMYKASLERGYHIAIFIWLFVFFLNLFLNLDIIDT